MKNSIYILISFLLLGFSINCEKSTKNDIKDFNKFLGKEKAKALNEGIKSFDKFLVTNYPNQNNQSDRTKEFLKKLSKSLSPDSSWIFTTRWNKEIIAQFESSELRKDIWIYGKESYDAKYNIYEIVDYYKQDSLQSPGDLKIIEDEIIPIPRPARQAIDSTELARQEKELEEQYNNTLTTNVNGEFLYGLAKYANNDSTVQGYVEVKIIAGDISPNIVASALLTQTQDFENPFIKRMIFVELYYWMIKWDIEINKTTTR